MPDEVTTEFLDAFGEAMNRHDIDAVMTFMTADCVFESYIGPDACGTRYEGHEQVRAGFKNIWVVCPDANFGKARHLIFGESGVSEWVFTGTTRDGQRIEVNGCDIFTFRDGKIAVKNGFRKHRTTR